MTQNRAFGLVAHDALLNNIKVNQVAVMNETTACSSNVASTSAQPWALLTNNRVGFQCTVTTSFTSFNTLADSDVFTLVEGNSTFVQVTGDRAGIIKFTATGVCQIQVYLEIVNSGVEIGGLYPMWMCLSPSTIPPDINTNQQVALLLIPNYYNNSAESTQI